MYLKLYRTNKIICSIPFRKQRRKERSRTERILTRPGKFLIAGPHAVIKAPTQYLGPRVNIASLSILICLLHGTIIVTSEIIYLLDAHGL